MTMLRAKRLIFDLDGVLVDTLAAVDGAWIWWGGLHGLDAESIRRHIHGMRARDAVALMAPHVDVDAEFAKIVEREQSLVDLMKPVPGVHGLLAKLPPGSWGIATSGERRIAQARLDHAGIVAPEVFLTAEDVERGKPDPQVYERAAARLGVAPADCLVFEDAPAGIASAAAAGATVIGILTGFDRSVLDVEHAVPDFRAVTVVAAPDGIELTLPAPGSPNVE